MASAWSLSRVPPSCAFLALPTVSSPQHRPATSPSWQESHGAKQTCRAPCFYTHLCRRSGLKEAASIAQLGIVSFWVHASKKSFVVPGQMEMPSWPRSRPAHPCACTHPCWLRGSGGRAEYPWGGWWLWEAHIASPAPLGQLSQPRGLRKGLGGGHGLFFSSQCTLNRSKGGKATGGRAEFGEQQLPPMQAAWPHAPRAEGDSGPLTPKKHSRGDGKVKDPRVPQPKAQQPQVGERRRSRGLPWEASRASRASSSSSSGGVTRSISAPRSTAQHRRARRKFHCAAERSSASTPRRPAGARSFPLALLSPAAPRGGIGRAACLEFVCCFVVVVF